MASSSSKLPVWLYVPNLIGYARLVLTAWNLTCNVDMPVTFLLVYGVSSVLDFFDGYFARVSGQPN